MKLSARKMAEYYHGHEYPIDKAFAEIKHVYPQVKEEWVKEIYDSLDFEDDDIPF